MRVWIPSLPCERVIPLLKTWYYNTNKNLPYTPEVYTARVTEKAENHRNRRNLAISATYVYTQHMGPNPYTHRICYTSLPGRTAIVWIELALEKVRKGSDLPQRRRLMGEGTNRDSP